VVSVTREELDRLTEYLYRLLLRHGGQSYARKVELSNDGWRTIVAYPLTEKKKTFPHLEWLGVRLARRKKCVVLTADYIENIGRAYYFTIICKKAPKRNYLRTVKNATIDLRFVEEVPSSYYLRATMGGNVDIYGLRFIPPYQMAAQEVVEYAFA